MCLECNFEYNKCVFILKMKILGIGTEIFHSYLFSFHFNCDGELN